MFYRCSAGRIERVSDREGRCWRRKGGQFVADTTGSKVGESSKKETFVEVAKEVCGDRRVSINQERASQWSTLPEDIDQERTGRMMDASVEDDARGVLRSSGW